MSIAGAGQSLIKLLEREFRARHSGDLQGLTFRVLSTANLHETLSDHVSLFLYRVEVDRTRRHRDEPPRRPRDPERWSLSLELRYLLTIWGKDAEKEQRVLEDCMSILDQNAVLAGDRLDATYSWPERAALKVTLETVSTEDMMRVWDSLTPSYRLSAPYLVRTVRLPATPRPTPSLVDTFSRVYAPGVPR